jgi:uncharacterized protein YneR
MKITSANGKSACLIYCADNQYRIRVYNKDHSFKDYDILHNDLSFVIDDADAYFYEDGQNMYIDYSPQTLGKY